MAEFCLECWNKISGTQDSEEKYVISEYLDLCEGCEEWKPVVIMERKEDRNYKFRYFTFTLRFISGIIFLIWRLMPVPYLLFKYKKSKNKCER